MLPINAIDPAKTEWASPAVFAPKNDGTLRLCVDYGKLIAVTNRDSYPLSRIDECVDSLEDVQVFSTFDAYSSYP